MSKEARQEDISRRKFLKFVGVEVGILGAGLIATGGLIAYERQKNPLAGRLERYPKELSLYGIEGVSVINSIEKQSGLIVSLPGTFLIPDPVEGQFFENEVWRVRELEAVLETINELPHKLALKENRVAFGVVRESSYPRIGGVSGYWPDSNAPFDFLGIHTPDKYKLEGQSSSPELWDNYRSEFKATLVHELTHRVIENDENLLSDYAERFGWEKAGDRWEYKGGLSITFIKLLEGYHSDYHNPGEDLAISSSLYYSAPEVLDEWDPDRARAEFLSERLYR